MGAALRVRRRDGFHIHDRRELPMTRTLNDLTVEQLRWLVHGAGDERMTLAEALGAMAAATEAGLEAERERRELQAATDAWLVGREAAHREAWHAEEAKHTGESSAASYAAGQEAGGEAAA